MILNAFSKYIQEINADIPAVILLSEWIREKLSKAPKDNVENVIHKEIAYFKNKQGKYMLIGKSESGIKLLEALYEYALSYDNHKFSKWIHKIKASDFN